MKFDDKNNIVEVCLFESYLAKFFIEHNAIFTPVISKVLDALEKVIALNASNLLYDRILFSIFSNLTKEFPDIKNISSIQQNNSIIVFDTFFKYFTERMINSIQSPPRDEDDGFSLPSLSILAQHSLFKRQKQGEAKLLRKMRPQELFSQKNRGVMEIDSFNTEERSNSFGILSSADTPENLKNYFSFFACPSRQFYVAKENSLMALWLRERYLPVIAGASGGVGKTISKINSLIPLSKTEYQLLGILIASSTIALGHHSFFEVMMPLSLITGPLQNKINLLEFYEQVIPETVKCLTSYKNHIQSSYGAQLIEEFVFEDTLSNENLNSIY